MNRSLASLISVLLGCVFSMPIAADVLPAAKVYRLGVLNIDSFSGPAGRAFFERLNQIGYVEGKNLVNLARLSEVQRQAAKGCPTRPLDAARCACGRPRSAIESAEIAWAIATFPQPTNPVAIRYCLRRPSSYGVIART